MQRARQLAVLLGVLTVPALLVGAVARAQDPATPVLVARASIVAPGGGGRSAVEPPVATNACPDDMVLIEGDYCPRVEQRCLRWMDSPRALPRVPLRGVRQAGALPLAPGAPPLLHRPARARRR